ncbi:MAG TPA: TRAP transporter substrate-binding protein [Gammaproteobacteria bacterium]|nr:TRAP transporter substrate-binding protein [Gammaproteobacteria bacterium]
MKFLSALCGIIALCVWLPAPAVVWDMPTPYDERNFHTVNIRQFADEVESETKGKLEIRVHSDGTLYKHSEIKNAVRWGQVPIGEFLLSRLSDEDAVFEIDAVPFLATTYEKAGYLWQASKPTIASLLDRQGLMILFAVPWPPEGLYSNRPLKDIADLRGLRVRADDRATAQLAKYFDAIPTRIESPDIPQAFSTGRVEAMINSPFTGANTKVWNFVGYFYHTQAWLPKNIVVVNKQAFHRLDGEAQKAVLAAAVHAELRGWKASREETSQKLDVLRDNGISVHRPENPLMQGLYRVGRKMTVDWSQKAGDDGIQIIRRYYSLH